MVENIRFDEIGFYRLWQNGDSQIVKFSKWSAEGVEWHYIANCNVEISFARRARLGCKFS